MTTLFATVFFAHAMFAAVLGIFVLGNDWRNRVHVTWGLTSAAVAVWAYGTSQELSATRYDEALVAGRYANAAAALIPAFYTHFALAMIGRRLKTSPVAIIGYGVALLVVASAGTPQFVPSVAPMAGLRWFVQPGPAYVVFTAQFVFLAGYSHWLFFYRLRERTPEQQNQIRWVATATLVGFGCGSAMFLPVYGVDLTPYPALLTSAYSIITAYAILKHGLLDIRVAITRTGAFLLIYSVVLGVPFGVGFWSRGALETSLGDLWWLVPLGLSTAMATLGPFAYARTQRQMEAFLLGELVRVRREADTDPLTRVLVRRAFSTRAASALDAAAREGGACSLLMIDLDHFKRINDTHGHLVGDAVLREVAARVRNCLRTPDLLGRFGGEEFLVLLVHIQPDVAHAVAERLRTSTAGSPIVAGSTQVRQTLSVGVASFPTDGETLEALVEAADAALYRAKELGRNRVEAA